MRHRAPVPRKWARRARALKPAPAIDRETAQLQLDLLETIQRLTEYGIPVHADLSRSGLTRVQRELRDATEASAQVAQDTFLQQFRKHLHLLLDH